MAATDGDEKVGEYSASWIERMDARRMEQEHELALERERTRQKLAESKRYTREEWARYAGYVGIALVVAAAAVAIAFFIYRGVTGPEKPDHEQERETACVDSGGGWVPKDMLDTSADDHGLCVYPGKPVK